MRDLRKHTPSSFNKDTAVKQEGCYLYLYWTVNLLLYSLIVAVFVALRLGTLRVYSMGGGNGGGDSSSIDNTALLYNHRETDERVFEVRLSELDL